MLSDMKKDKKKSRRYKCSLCCLKKILLAPFHGLDRFYRWSSEGPQFFSSCFLGLLSIRTGCHAVFLLVLASSIVTILLNTINPTTSGSTCSTKVCYWEVVIHSFAILVIFSFLYAYMRKEIGLILATFYSLLLLGLFNLSLFIFSQDTFKHNHYMMFINPVMAFLNFYLAGIVVSYIQGRALIDTLHWRENKLLEVWRTGTIWSWVMMSMIMEGEVEIGGQILGH